MRTIELAYPHTFTEENLPETVCAIGFFDGIHKGHQKVICSAMDQAKLDNRESAVMTFHPHPSVVLKPEVHQVKYITPMEQKQAILQKLGVDRLYIVTFNKSLSTLSPKEFIDHFIKRLHIKHVIAGFDFTYGYKGQGNMELLSSLANGQYQTTTIPKFEIDGEKVSSTKIRKLLNQGNVKEANKLLGSPFSVEGEVIKGDQRGRTIGFPTANISITNDTLLPLTGVYAVKIHMNDKAYNGMANLGYVPTFKDKVKSPRLEINIFDFHDNIYGKRIKIEWHHFIREEKKFHSVDELVAQLKADEQIIRNYLK